MEEINALPTDWVECYTRERFMLFDPVIRWSYQSSGAIRWSEIAIADPRGILEQARAHGLLFGAAVAVHDEGGTGQRSFGSFLRADREYREDEMAALFAHLEGLHQDRKPPSNLTQAEIEALRMVKDGLRLKQIAHELGVTEGAVKQRLKNAKAKLGAATGTQAATLARGYGLI
ncbi:MAG: autoinducer binding domain-containing protein [Rubellimicrobium sp.]|nr:autoinducer binding domain-containing protein [Rubellimicrobium sp.]